MKKFIYLFLFLPLLLIFVFTGCSSTKFSNQSTYENLNPTADIILSIGEINLQDKQLTLLITNKDSIRCSHDGVYYIEKKIDEEWYSMDAEQVFNALGYKLEANSTNDLTVSWKDELPDGVYRIIKPIYAEDGTNYYSVNFTIGE